MWTCLNIVKLKLIEWKVKGLKLILTYTNINFLLLFVIYTEHNTCLKLTPSFIFPPQESFSISTFIWYNVWDAFLGSKFSSHCYFTTSRFVQGINCSIRRAYWCQVFLDDTCDHLYYCFKNIEFLPFCVDSLLHN